MGSVNINERNKALEGIKLAARHVGELTVSTQSICTKPSKRNKVGIVVCGSAGYEAQLGFMLGENLADAIVIEPKLDPYTIMRTAISVNYGNLGVLFLCGSSEEEKSAIMAAGGLLEESGFNSEVVYVEDNIALDGADNGCACRINAGFFYCVKIAGAAAASGMTLKETYYTVRKARNLVKSISVESTPLAGGRLKENGGRISGGLDRTGDLFSENLIEQVSFQLRQASRARTRDTVCIYINGSGGVSLSELGKINFYLYRSLTERGITVHDAVINPVPFEAGHAGAAISMMLLTGELEKYYDMPCSALYFKKEPNGSPMK